MKKIIIAAVLAFSTNVLADAQLDIYMALNVAPVDLAPEVAGASTMKKSVGGFSCIKHEIIYPGAVPTVDCVLDDDNCAKEIYNALNLTPVHLNPGIVGATRLEKAVGGLSCIEETIIVPNAEPTYSCTYEAQ